MVQHDSAENSGWDANAPPRESDVEPTATVRAPNQAPEVEVERVRSVEILVRSIGRASGTEWCIVGIVDELNGWRSSGRNSNRWKVIYAGGGDSVVHEVNLAIGV